MANFDALDTALDALGAAIVDELQQLKDALSSPGDQAKVDAIVARVQGYVDSLKSDDPAPPTPPAPQGF